MLNEIGCVLWGTADGRIIANPDGVHVCCWRSPWCRWLDNKTFVFKIQHYDGQTTRTPMVAIHVDKGFFVIPESAAPDIWADQVKIDSPAFRTFDPSSLLKSI